MSRRSAPAERPQIVAHRGDSHEEPEHTLAAYLRAVDEGADALECDVRLTADGHLVCLHDRLVDRTSDGRGPISTTDLATLRELDFGSWKSGRRDTATGTEERTGVLTLRRLLALVADMERPVELAIETKHPNRYGGLVERRLVETLEEFGWARPAAGRGPSRVRVMSFSLLALRRMRLLAPQLPLVLLQDRLAPPFRDGSPPRGVSTFGIGISLLREHPDFGARVRDHGGQVHVWTVDTPQDVQLCLETGAEAIITNRPGLVRSLVQADPGVPGRRMPVRSAHNDGVVPPEGQEESVSS